MTTDPMTADNWLQEVQRRKVPDRLYIEGAKIIEAQRRENEQLREQLAEKAEGEATA